jgi:hypothetical protein
MTPTIQEVKARHEGRLMTMPGVVSVGLGQKPDGTPLIVVGLDRRRPATMAQLPQILDGYAVSVEFVGEIRAQEKGRS